MDPTESLIQDTRVPEKEALRRLLNTCELRAAAGPSAAGRDGSDPMRAATWGGYRFTLDGSNDVLVKDQRIHLHPRQFAVAFTFFCNLEQTVSHEVLLKSYWGSSRASDRSRALVACVSQVRSRLHLDGANEFTLLRASGRNFKLTSRPPSWF